ncbi:MAG: hypothetical protein U0527_03915 [Candidatus Eisenbacteria bacterium]
MYQHIVDPDFMAEVSSGKYTRWASTLSADTLEALLWLIGTFGARFSVLRREMGFYAGPVFCLHMGSEHRVHGAIHALATIQSGEPVTWGMYLFTHTHLSSERRVFDSEYQQRLAQREQTRWASGLDEQSLALLIWMVGEYSGRVRSHLPPPSFPVAPDDEWTLRNALTLISMIYDGRELTVLEAEKFMADLNGIAPSSSSPGRCA